MKIRISEDEDYPVFRLWEAIDCSATVVEVPAETVKRWKKVLKEYEEVQEEMEAYWRKRNE
jgi:hypothetical protein